MTTENGKELGGHHCPDWDGLWVTPSSPEHEACTCYIGSAMTTNKPEVVAYFISHKYKWGTKRVGVRLLENHDPSCVHEDWDYEPLVRLSDYESLQAECEKLRKDAEFGRSVLSKREQGEVYGCHCDLDEGM